MDAEHFATQMHKLWRSHYRERMPDKSVMLQVGALYWDALCDLTDDELEYAVAASLRASAFFPKPAELRALARPPKPARDPEAEFDLIAGARANMSTLPQLPPGVTEEQAAARRLDWERLKADTLAAIRAGGDRAKQDRPTASQEIRRIIDGYTPLAPNPAADRLLLDVPARMAAGLAAYERSQEQKRQQMADGDESLARKRVAAR